MTKYSRMRRKAYRKYKRFESIGWADVPFDRTFILAWGSFKNRKRPSKKILKECGLI